MAGSLDDTSTCVGCLCDGGGNRQPVGGTVAAARARPVLNFIRLFIGNGTAANPNAGLLVGNGFSYDAGTCTGTAACAGGRGGFLVGNGGNGWNGGSGGSAGLFGTAVPAEPGCYGAVTVAGVG